MAESIPLITLMTDFGYEDTFVGVMKGVIAGICPAARVIDLTHAIPRFDVVQAAFRLHEAFPSFPKGTVHVVVVDPGVGSDRRIAAMRSAGHFFIAPDNGALALIEQKHGADALVEVTSTEKFLPQISASFHGRDIFAPVAAHLAAGLPLPELGPVLHRLQPLDIPKVEVAGDGSITGVVLWCDHFGNLITNIRGDSIKEGWPGGELKVHLAGRVIDGLSKTYADVSAGELLAMIGSFGALEIAARLGSARELLDAGPSAAVRVTRT